jgi:two-component system LytT family response regulator
MRVLIADDEEAARERLRQMLEAHPDVHVVGMAGNGVDAARLVRELRPDLVMLDIQMPGATGLDVAASLPPPRPVVIFCTAYEEHALEGFELNAADYLLKPVSRKRLAEALKRAEARHAHAARAEGPGPREEPLTRFLVRSGTRYTVVAAGRVLYLEAVDGLTRLILESGAPAWVDPPLNEMEARLDAARFFRISRAAIVNLQAVAELHRMPGGSAELVLKNGDRLEVSRRRLRELLLALESG